MMAALLEMAPEGLDVCGADGAESVSIGAGLDAGLASPEQAKLERLAGSELDREGEDELAALLEMSGDVENGCAKSRKIASNPQKSEKICQDAEALL